MTGGTGIFGGSFDPPHIGHLIVAQHVREEFALENIVFLPAGNPPHKSCPSPFPHRLRMIELAIRGVRGFQVCPIEGGMTGMTYTIDVVRELKRRGWRSLHLMIGADQWRELDAWKNPRGILRQARLIVLPRPGYPIARRSSAASRIVYSTAPLIGVSSTMIRERIRTGRSIRYLVPDPVIRYIRRNRLRRLWSRRNG